MFHKLSYHFITPFFCILDKALSTNMLYYSGYNFASKMGKELGAPEKLIHDLEEQANLLKSTIQQR